MVDGSALCMSMIWGLRSNGSWHDERGVNLLDTGAPFYDTYECADGEYVAVGAIEPQFFAALCRVLGLSPEELGDQADRAAWPAVRDRFAAIFRQRPRDEWVARAEAEEGDACLVPVLSMPEATRHPHNEVRRTFVTAGGVTQPNVAPRFSATPVSVTAPPCRPGEHGLTALQDWGLDARSIAAATSSGALKAH
jgi:alpha-methylacyl-CoA racemase